MHSPFNQKNPYLAPVGVNRELHKGGDRSCMHIEFDITGSKLKYTAGDHVAVLAENDPTLVEKIGKLLNIDLETVFSLTNNDGELLVTPAKPVICDILHSHIHTRAHTHTHTHAHTYHTPHTTHTYNTHMPR